MRTVSPIRLAGRRSTQCYLLGVTLPRADYKGAEENGHAMASSVVVPRESRRQNMLPRIKQHKVRGLPFCAVRSHIADQIRSRHCGDIARITHRVASATERSQCLDCQDEDRQQLPCSHKISSWKTMLPDSSSKRADDPADQTCRTVRNIILQP